MIEITKFNIIVLLFLIHFRIIFASENDYFDHRNLRKRDDSTIVLKDTHDAGTNDKLNSIGISRSTEKASKYVSKTKKKNNSNDNSNILYYISTNEGIISHLRQLELLWNIANSVGKKVYVVGFESPHYRNVKNILLCDIFELPSNISCTKRSSIRIFNEEKCYYTGYLFPPEHYHFPTDKLVMVKSFNYADINCIAGGITFSIGNFLPWKRRHIVAPPFFKKKYLEIFPKVKKLLGLLQDEEYALVHWRRGDQLNTRCKKLQNSTANISKDNSFNCGTVEQFDSSLYLVMSQYLALPIKTYVATNEENLMNIMYLKSKKFLTYSDFDGKLLALNPTINILDLYVFEIMLMCDSTYFFAWGESSVHQFIFKCRNLDTYHKHITIMDNEIKTFN